MKISVNSIGYWGLDNLGVYDTKQRRGINVNNNSKHLASGGT